MIIASLYLLPLIVMTIDSRYRLKSAQADALYIKQLLKEN